MRRSNCGSTLRLDFFFFAIGPAPPTFGKQRFF
jgi:hypothetical protein